MCVFLSFSVLDFDMATLNGKHHFGNTEMFSSSGFFRKQHRYPIDDFESLVFSIWNIAGIPMDSSGKPDGLILAECTKIEDAEKFMKVH